MQAGHANAFVISTVNVQQSICPPCSAGIAAGGRLVQMAMAVTKSPWRRARVQRDAAPCVGNLRLNAACRNASPNEWMRLKSGVFRVQTERPSAGLWPTLGPPPGCIVMRITSSGASKIGSLRSSRNRSASKEAEVASSWSSPLVVAFIGAAIAAVASVWTNYSALKSSEELEQRKWIQSQVDEKEKRVSALLAELAQALNKTLTTHNRYLQKYVTDERRKVLMGVKIDESKYAFWNSPDYVEAFESVQSSMLKIGVENRLLYDELLTVVHDVRIMHLEVALVLKEENKVARTKVSRHRNIDPGIRPTWREFVHACQTKLGRNLFEAYNRVRPEVVHVRVDYSYCASSKYEAPVPGDSR